MLSLERLDIDALSRDWKTARPFPHVVIDELLAPAPFEQLQEAARAEPLFSTADEIYQHRGSAEPPSTPLLRAFGDELAGAPVREALRAITGTATSGVSLRAYRYDRGDYLLPHTDWRPAEGRRIAFAYYLGQPGGESPDDARLRGGELLLYACESDGSQLVRTRPVRTIAPRANRMALFDVSPLALHRVREVTSGQRLSLAGWFIA